jgi:hypothetical protein
MSATNRGADRLEADNYPTPSWCVRRLLEAVKLPLMGRILEPCAGEGGIIDALPLHGELWACEVRPECETALAECADRVVIHDFTDVQGWPTFDCVITNPPFALAERIIHCALSLPGSPVVVMLLRLNFLEGAARAAWLRAQPPDVYVLPERPSFAHKVECVHEKVGDAASGVITLRMRGCGWSVMIPHTDIAHEADCPMCGGPTRRKAATDATGYGWFVWPRERERAQGIVRVLASTPRQERQAA